MKALGVRKWRNMQLAAKWPSAARQAEMAASRRERR